MKKIALFAISLSFLISCQEKKEFLPANTDWCPQGLQVGAYAKIEGIVDYENINWCKMIIKAPDATLEVYYTQDGTRQRVVQYAGNIRRTEVEIRRTKAVMRIYDKQGKLAEELQSREYF